MAAKLSVINSSASGIKPARTLGKPGMTLWKSIMSEYEINDAGGVELLTLACSALDRSEECRAQIDRAGEIINTKHGPKEHPLLKIELANRAFVSRTLSRLGLDVEAIKPMGRPPQQLHWKGEE